MELMAFIGETVRLWRLKRAMTQIELAEAAGLGVNTIRRIEANNTEPRPSTLRKLAKGLEVDPADLIR